MTVGLVVAGRRWVWGMMLFMFVVDGSVGVGGCDMSCGREFWDIVPALESLELSRIGHGGR